MSAEIAAKGRQAAAAKATPFAGGNKADVRQNRRRCALWRSRQKPRLLPAATELMSAEIAAKGRQAAAGESHAFRRRQQS